MKMIKKIMHRGFWCFLCFVLAVLLLPVSAFAETAVDTEKPATLTVECKYDGRALSGVNFDLYKVADMETNARYTVTPAFSSYAISFEQESAAGWRALAETLAQYARRDNIPVLANKDTGSDGKVIFADLDVGMYLVCGHRYSKGDFVYDPEPFLVSLPSLDENNDWYYAVQVNCKGEGHTTPEIPETTTVKVLKVWDDDNHKTNRPEKIEVELLRDGKVYSTVTLSAENRWSFTWTRLDANYTWSVIEKSVPENYTLLVSKEGITFVLTNTYSPTFTTVEVEKLWNDSGYENRRPTAIEVQLLCDGNVEETTTLSATNNWKHTWNNLDADREWTVKEKSSPAGYTSSIRQNGGKFTITNTYTPPSPPDKPKLPQTGQLWWPVPLFLSMGCICYLVGFAWRKKRVLDDDNKK